MKAKKLIALGLLAFMLAGCGMPKVDYNGVDSPLFVKDESGAAASGNESVTGSAGTALSDSTTAESPVTDSVGMAGGRIESRTDNKTDSKLTDSLTDSIPTESSVASGSVKNDTLSKDSPVQLSVERVSINDYEYDSREDVSYLGSTVQYLTLGEDDGEEYEKLATRLETLSDDTIAACEDTFDELLDEAKEAYADDKNDFQTYELKLTAVPVRTDSSIFSYYEKTTLTGGERDEVSLAAHTVDSKTGRELTLSKVITDTDLLPELLAKRQKESYPDISDDVFEDLLGEYEDKDYIWTLGYDGITFYFVQDGEVMALTILRSEEKKLFRPLGESVPSGYAVGLDMSQAFTFDFDDDGEADVLTIEGNEGEEYGYDGVNVTLNDESARASFISNSMIPTYVHTEDGDYIYLFCTGDSDYQQLNIFSLGKGVPSYSGHVDNAGKSNSYDAETDLSSEVLLTDPESFELASNMDILSTYTAGRSYFVGADGIPKSDDTYYYVHSNLVLESKENISCSIVNERGRVTKKKQTIKSGTEWTIYRTDGEKTVDLILSDDRIARVTVDSSNWPQTIDGEDISDLFDGVRFAG
ncbi:MAG: hypothetical protein IJH11_09725 [Lachnospiraceae bacterium]|nr:hypothetical protein [Lachnospiraceae bacterium]